MRRPVLCISLLLVLVPAASTAQFVSDETTADEFDNHAAAAGRAPVLNISTNLLYDLAMMPSVGLEVAVAGRVTFAVSGTYGWLDGLPLKDKVRVATADAELRYWTGRETTDRMRRGLHLGAYGAVYRYDFLFSGKGQEAKANWGAGLTCGYAVPLGCCFSLDLGLGLGYVSGKYKKYEVSNDELRHNVWMADKVRHYLGPTKAEAALVWHIGGKAPKTAKGGSR